MMETRMSMMAADTRKYDSYTQLLCPIVPLDSGEVTYMQLASSPQAQKYLHGIHVNSVNSQREEGEGGRESEERERREKRESERKL